MTTKIIKVFVFLLVINIPTFSQVNIDLPLNKSVFQRNGSSQATIYIAGTYSNTVVSSIQARLLNPTNNAVISGFDWTIIKSNPSKGQFYGQLNNVPAGWYKLEVRTVNTGSVLSSTNVDRVGVGDVYLISGQSNAAGLDPNDAAYTPPPVTFNEKSLSHNTYQGCTNTYPSFAQLSAINSGQKVSASGESPWAYSELGNKLANNLNMPVVFFNAGASGTSIENWLTSSNGGATYHPFLSPLTQYCGVVGAPYYILKNVMSNYPNLYGVRAIIWHQGESDTHLNTTQADYQSKLSSFISKTRTDFGENIPWMVSRASYFQGNTSVNVINGQNAIINNSNQIFAGPETDGFTSPDRTDDIHFNSAGLVKFANGLYNSIKSTNFLTSSIPITAKTLPEISMSITNGSVTLTAPGGYSAYKWVPGNDFNAGALGTSASFSSSSGTYRCYLTDANGNITMTQAVNVNNVLSQQSLSSTYVDSLFLAEYVPYSLSNPIGPVAFNKTVGGSADGDGSTMSLNSISYPKGIGTHSGSEVVYKMKTGFHSKFKATIGIDDSAASGGNVKFKVYGGATLLYTSPAMTKLSSAINISVNIAGYSSIKLVVENNGGTVASNQANWANARIIFDKPKNLTTPKIYRFCIQLGWTADNDMNGIVSYQIFKDDVLEATVPAGTLNYTFTNLAQSTAYKLSVKAIDANGYGTAKVDTTVSTITVSMKYSAEDAQVCIGENTIPEAIPAGGSFKLISKPDSVTFSLNSSVTGEVLFNSDGFVRLLYTWEEGTACADSFYFYVGGNVKPSPPTISNAADSLINNGTTLTLNASACSNDYTLEWFNQTTSPSVMVSPNDTTSYFAYCKNSSCYSESSNKIKVKVIPDCPNSFNLVSAVDDLNYGTKSFYFNASKTIDASNKLSNPTGATFKAAENIELNPGFEIQAGSVFSATIGGCP